MSDFLWKCPYCVPEKGWNSPNRSHCGDCGEIKPLAVILQDAPEWIGQQSQAKAKRVKSLNKGEKVASKKLSEEEDLEERFFSYWGESNTGYTLIRQHRGIFKHINKRGKAIMTNHKFDFALPDLKLAIEIQGGIFNRGRHVRPQGYHDDRAKMRKAQAQGWVVFEFTTIDINKKNLHNVVNEVLAEIEQLQGLGKVKAA